MPRKQPRRVGPATEGRAGPPPAPSEPLPAIPLLVFALLALVCTLLYFVDAPAQHVEQRQSSLTFLVAPDHLFVLWCGGKLAFFSILDRWPIVLLAMAVLAGAWLAGRLVLLALGLMPRLDALERAVFSMAVGLNAFSLYVLAIGLAGALRQRWVFVTPLLVLVVANALLGRRKKTVVRGAPGPSLVPAKRDRWWWLLLAGLPFALVILFGSMLPPWDYDVREYHLQTPKEWYENGRVEFLPHNLYANMPLGSELNSIWAMALCGGADGWWWGAMAGKTVMACYSLVAAAGLIAFGRRLHSLAAGMVAAVLFLSTPWIPALATAGYNEGPVALYALLAIFALFLGRQDENQSHVSRFILLSGFLAGSAVACKYPPLLFVVVPLFLSSLVIGHWSFDSLRQFQFGKALQHGVFFLLAVSAACGPWFAKNAVLTNNPTYPLLYSIFDGRTRTLEKDRQFTKVHSPQPDEQGNRFSPRQFVDQVTWNTWRTLGASLAIPALFVVSILAPRPRSFVMAMASWIGFVFLAWWLTTHRLDRFLVLLLPIASLVAALGAVALDHPAWRACTIGFVVCTAIVNFPFVTLRPDNRYFAPLDQLRRDDSELGIQGHHVESAHRWINQHAQPGEKVLLLGDAEPFDLEIKAVYNTCFDDCQFTRIFEGRTREERLAILREETIAYVFCSWYHLGRFRSPGNYGYTSDYPTRELVHQELVHDQGLLIPIKLEAEAELGELFRVAEGL